MTPERWQKSSSFITRRWNAKKASEWHICTKFARAMMRCGGKSNRYWRKRRGRGGFLESPAVEVAAKALAEDESQSSLLGQQLGSYKIVSLLGAGGMGEVYQAHDTKLGRDVAIKVLPAAFVHDPERLARFQREARMLAALNHPEHRDDPRTRAV